MRQLYANGVHSTTNFEESSDYGATRVLEENNPIGHLHAYEEVF